MNEQIWRQTMEDVFQAVNKWVEEQDPRPTEEEVASYAKAYYERVRFQVEGLDWPRLVLVVDKDTSLVKSVGGMDR